VCSCLTGAQTSQLFARAQDRRTKLDWETLRLSCLWTLPYFSGTVLLTRYVNRLVWDTPCSSRVHTAIAPVGSVIARESASPAAGCGDLLDHNEVWGHSCRSLQWWQAARVRCGAQVAAEHDALAQGVCRTLFQLDSTTDPTQRQVLEAEARQAVSALVDICLAG